MEPLLGKGELGSLFNAAVSIVGFLFQVASWATQREAEATGQGDGVA
jgi:hypothetical protein